MILSGVTATSAPRRRRPWSSSTRFEPLLAGATRPLRHGPPRSIARTGTLLVLSALLASFGLGAAPVAAADPDPGANAAPLTEPPTAALCPPADPGYASCLSLIRTDIAPLAAYQVAPFAAPSGFGPADLLAAYNLPGIDSGIGSGRTVAIVDAYDLPTAEADLGTYRSQYGLPACTAASGCFRKVNQNGQASPLPAPNTGWGGEIALDMEMVSAICPSCKILLVEATSASYTDLGTAVNTAAGFGPVAISNSYGGAEVPNELSLDAAYYDHPGIAVTVSSGDYGYGVDYPASSSHVVAVGGTRLTTAANTRGWTETVWYDATKNPPWGPGSGCSAYAPKPTWQLDTGCARRTVADVSAVADTNPGVAVYSASQGGWVSFGGTSVAAPIIASIYALAGTPTAGTYPAAYPYANPGSLNDVISGSNGSCGGSYLCTAGVGYDGPTGLGTPNGIAAFSASPPPRPAVTAITPTSGPAAGGTSVTISGTNLAGATAVRFGGASAASFTANQDGTIGATSPAGTGTVDVTVTTLGGTSATSSADQFTYATGVGFLRVTSDPAVPSQISLNGAIADSWGLNWLELPVGSYTVHFSHVEGYSDPADQTVSVAAGATTTVAGAFTARGSLHVTTSPAVAAAISVDGIPRNDWGMWTDVPTGSHHVCFGPTAGYTAPACQDVTVSAGTPSSVTGTYTAGP